MDLNKKIIFLLISSQILILLLSSYFIRLDDAYIFYNYAKNLAEGNGYVFNLNEKINATTSFVYTIILALLYLPFQSNSEILLPAIGSILSILSLLISAFLLADLFSEELGEYKFILPIIFLSMPLIKNAIGMETFLKMSLMLIFLLAYKKQKFLLMNLIGSILFLTRPDTIILIFIVWLSYFVRFKDLVILKSSFIFFIVILIYLIISYLYFGSVIPTSLNVKITQSELKLINGNFFEGFVSAFPGGEIVAYAFFIFLFFAFIILVKNERAIFKNEFFKIISSYFITYTLIYGLILNPPPYPWYFTDFMIIYTLVIIFTFKSLIEKFKSKLLNPKNVVLILLIFLVGIIAPIKTIKIGYNEKFLLYNNAALFLNSFSSVNTKLAMDEIGIAGFYFKGKIVDELGLITPEAVEGLKQKDFLFTIKKTNSDFVIADFPRYPTYKSYIKSKWFNQNYSEFFTLKYFNLGVRIYRKTK